MIFTCNKQDLQDAILIAQKAITGKSTLPILEGILIKAQENTLTLIGSDKDVSIETKLVADIKQPGDIVIDSKIFGEIIRKLPNDKITIETLDKNTVQITCLKSVFNIVYMDANQFPELPMINENQIFSIPQSTLKNMIKGTSFAITQDESRPILQGILFEVNDGHLNLVALDGYRLAIRTELLDTSNSINAVIPGRTLIEVAKILEDSDENVNITFTTNHILFSLENTKVISRLLEGEYIKYNSLLPQEYKLLVNVKRQDLQNGIERASLMSTDSNSNLIKLNIESDTIIITSNSQLGKVREEVAIDLQGESLQIAFNSRYILDILKNMEAEEIVMEFTSSVSPCILKDKESDNCKYLVLPVRLIK
ncbi:DNA polymerase III subunit beta [Inconstantimicrobium porci]|uniref:Beta sliding clamp n=1 Tax=Inconstantimicrobium porci TaxID=2652291 RepID=A0A7X2T1I1_9CLOT|nr:DNA polymerase III subunit beta [Inconstantimicrobium porci]MSR91681.1 DNA polymerase III subunit beta [Inconstantimicrobium porci]